MPAKGWKLNKETGKWERDPNYVPETATAASTSGKRGGDGSGGQGSGSGGDNSMGMDERGLLAGLDQFELPKGSVVRIAKNAVPPGVTLRKEVQVAVVKGSTVFVSYLAAIAAEVAAARNQKTIMPEHIYAALQELDWEEDEVKQMQKMLKGQLKEFKKRRVAKKTGVRPGAPGDATAGTSNGNAVHIDSPDEDAPGDEAAEDSPFEAEDEVDATEEEGFEYEDETEGDNVSGTSLGHFSEQQGLPVEVGAGGMDIDAGQNGVVVAH